MIANSLIGSSTTHGAPDFSACIARLLICLLCVTHSTPGLQSSGERRSLREGKAYLDALSESARSKQIQLLQAFVKAYPHSPKRASALRKLIHDYLAGDPSVFFTGQLLKPCQDLLDVDPNDLEALYLLTTFYRTSAEAGNNMLTNMAVAARYAKQGLRALKIATKPEDLTQEQFAELKKRLIAPFYSAIGINAILRNDLAVARRSLFLSLEHNRDDAQIAYQLALACLKEPKPSLEAAVLFLALATATVNDTFSKSYIDRYGRQQYVKLHGTESGWEALVSESATAKLPSLERSTSR